MVFKQVPQWYSNLAGQQYNVGEKPTVILYHTLLILITMHSYQS